jgi:hypothetical protein
MRMLHAWVVATLFRQCVWCRSPTKHQLQGQRSNHIATPQFLGGTRGERNFSLVLTTFFMVFFSPSSMIFAPNPANSQRSLPIYFFLQI